MKVQEQEKLTYADKTQVMNLGMMMTIYNCNTWEMRQDVQET